MTITAEKLFYTLAGFLLLTALFVLRPNQSVPVASLQNQMIGEFSVAWQQTFGDQSYFDDLSLVFDSINNFYDQASEASIALFHHGAGDRDLALVFKQTYVTLAEAITKLSHNEGQTLAQTGPDVGFMSQSPIYNIIPAAQIVPGTVSGTRIEPVNAQAPWVTIRDNLTGQLYCIAVYNNEVNKYLGSCKYDDYH